MRVGTWNVENLFTPGAGYGPSEQSVFTEKIAGLAATITDAGLDVVAVQEVGDEDAFAALIDALGSGWAGELSTQFATQFATPHTIRNGILSRLPIKTVSEHDAIPSELQGVPVDDNQTALTAMGRGALHIRVTTSSNVAVDVVSLHLKSKLITYPGGRFTPRDEAERARVRRGRRRLDPGDVHARLGQHVRARDHHGDVHVRRLAREHGGRHVRRHGGRHDRTGDVAPDRHRRGELRRRRRRDPRRHGVRPRRRRRGRHV